MATKQHKQRFPDTFPPIPSGEKTLPDEKKMASGIEEQGEEGKPAKLILVRKGFTTEQKRFIVESFACFQGVSEIAAELKRRWQIEPDLRHIAQYDARRPQCAMGKSLRLYYDQCRKAYVEGVAEVAISHQAHRLRLLGRVIEKANNSKDFNAAIKGLELAAKEMGGALSGQHVVRHEGMIGHVHATVEEAKAEIASRLTQVLEAGTLLLPAVATPPATEGEGGA